MSCNDVTASAVTGVTGVMSGWGVVSCVLEVIVAAPGTTISTCGFGMSLSTLSGLKGYKPVAAHPDLILLWVNALSHAGLYE